VIFPDADLKIYLTASLEERAKRRLLQVSNSESQTESLERLKLEIAKRDEQDSNRTTAPLCRASDAILVDTTELDVEQSLQRLSEIICQRLPHIC
jgi:cytidylate kinase